MTFVQSIISFTKKDAFFYNINNDLVRFRDVFINYDFLFFFRVSETLDSRVKCEVGPSSSRLLQDAEGSWD